MPATAVLMPTTRPRPSDSAPPEFPGLSAASVWITLSTIRPAATVRERPSCDTTPAVTDPCEAVWVPDCDHELTDTEALGISELGRGEVAFVEPQNGEI